MDREHEKREPNVSQNFDFKCVKPLDFTMTSQNSSSVRSHSKKISKQRLQYNVLFTTNLKDLSHMKNIKVLMAKNLGYHR